MCCSQAVALPVPAAASPLPGPSTDAPLGIQVQQLVLCCTAIAIEVQMLCEVQYLIGVTIVTSEAVTIGLAKHDCCRKHAQDPRHRCCAATLDNCSAV